MSFKIPHLQLGKNAVFLLKTLAAAVVMAFVMHFAIMWTGGVFAVPAAAGKFIKALYLAGHIGISGLAGIIVFTVAVFALRTEEALMIFRYLRGSDRRDVKN